jgi:UDP-N-acetylglucosamine 1-carboxyvinyltransferase
MSKYLIEGGAPLRGEVQISGSKNAAIKEIAISLLTTDPLTLSNIPEISDVAVDLEIVQSLGVTVDKPRPGTLVLRSSDKLKTKIPTALSSKSRAAIIAMGPLLVREGRVSLATPGGCPIGKRPLDRHLAALEKLGASFQIKKGTIEGRAEKLVGGRINFDKNTVMGTESAIITASLAEGDTEIRGAALEPEVDDLITLLTKMGAIIERDVDDPRLVRIEGVQTLKGAKHAVLPDRNEAVTFAVAAAITRGDVVLSDLEATHLTSFLAKLEKVGVRYSIEGAGKLRVCAEEDTEFAPVDIITAPHPGFMTDWQQPFSLLLALAKGGSLVQETVFENRWGYLSELKKFGVRAKLFTPEELGKTFNPKDYGFNWSASRRKQPNVYAKVSGPVVLTGAKVMVRDLRAGATLVLAALAAKGESEVSGVEHIERGYERFEEKLRGLGAKIEKREDTEI